jgi:hypothetical protein
MEESRDSRLNPQDRVGVPGISGGILRILVDGFLMIAG